MEPQYKGRMENILAELGRKIDLAIEKARGSSGEVPHEFAAKMEDLNRAKERVERELRSFANDDEKWKEVQSCLHNAADELKKAFELTFNRKSGEKG